MRQLLEDNGYTLVELLVAVLVLTIGILSLTTVLASSNSNSGVSERQQAEINRAQREIERIESLPYSQIAMTSAPTGNASNTNDPNYYVTASGGSCPSFQWNQSPGQTQGSSNTDALVINGCAGVSGGTLTTGGQPWSDSSGRSGSIYDFVTWVTDSKCSPGCPSSNDYKRITVAITNGQGAPYKPILISATIADPHANGGTNPSGNPSVSCTNSQGQTVACSSGLGSQTANSWYLTDSAAAGSYAVPATDHATHFTVSASNQSQCSGLSPTSGCPVPDLLINSPPAGTTCHNYSTDQGSPDPCGRVLNADTSCGGTTTTTDSTRGALWTTPALTSSKTLTGSGGMTLYTATVGATSPSITLCVGVYDVSTNAFSDSLAYPPTKLGAVAYTLAQWPATATPISFTFNFLASGTVSIPSGDRIGVRLWTAGGAVPIQVLYDGSSYPSQVTLNSQ